MSQIDDLQKRLSELEKLVKEGQKAKIDALEKATNGIRGNPLIQGYNGMRLTLNESLNVLQLKKELATLSAQSVATAQEYSDSNIAEVDAAIAAMQAAIDAVEAAIAALFTGLTANKILKFDGSGLTNSSITDTGSLVTVGSVLYTNGTRVKNARTTTTPYSLTSAVDTVWCDTDSNVVTVNLPAGVSGERHRIINCGSAGNDVTVTPNGSELLDGANASKTLSDGGVLDLEYETTGGWR